MRKTIQESKHIEIEDIEVVEALYRVADGKLTDCKIQ